MALAITISVSVSVGVLCAVYEGSIIDKMIRSFVFLGTAMPSFWIGLLLMWLFAVKLDLLPTSGMESRFSSYTSVYINYGSNVCSM